MRWLVASAVLAGLLSPARADADAWRCGSRLVAVGDLAAQVLATCGSPASIDRRTRTTSVRDEPRARGRALRARESPAEAPAVERSIRDVRARRETAVATTSNIEEWSYRADGGELVRTLVFEDGRLVSILVGGRAPVDTRRCLRQLFSRGTPATEVRLVCGEPVQEDRWIEVVEEEVREGVFVAKSRTRERWVYSFGPDTFLRIFELEEGRLVDQSTGGRGFDVP